MCFVVEVSLGPEGLIMWFALLCVGVACGVRVFVVSGVVGFLV